MSHSRILAPAVPKCGTCKYKKVRMDRYPCYCCDMNRNYESDNGGIRRNGKASKNHK